MTVSGFLVGRRMSCRFPWISPVDGCPLAASDFPLQAADFVYPDYNYDFSCFPPRPFMVTIKGWRLLRRRSVAKTTADVPLLFFITVWRSGSNPAVAALI